MISTDINPSTQICDTRNPFYQLFWKTLPRTAAMSTSRQKSGQGGGGGDEEVDAAVREARHLQLAQFSISQAVRWAYYWPCNVTFVLKRLLL